MKRALLLALALGPVTSTILAFSAMPYEVYAADTVLEFCMDEVPMSRAEVSEHPIRNCTADSCLDFSDDERSSETVFVPFSPLPMVLPPVHLQEENAPGDCLRKTDPPDPVLPVLQSTVVLRE